MIELLKLCGFEANELESELPRIERTFNRVGITSEDIEQAKQRLAKYYDTELQGVRKMLRLYLQELVNLVLAREEGKKKIIYGFMSPGFEMIGSALMSKSEEVYATSPAQVFQLVLGSLFGKLVPILEAAEKKWVKAGAVAHCANVKTIVGLFALDLIPKPDLLVTAGFLCETAPKTIDLLHQLSDMPTSCYDTCHDREFREHPDAKRITNLAVKSMRKLTERMQEVAGFEITDEMLWEVLDARKSLADGVLKLQNLLESSDPLPISATHEILWYSLGGLSPSIDNLRGPIEATNTLYEELLERVNKGLGVMKKGAPRIFAILPPHFADPRLEHLLGEVGIATVATEGYLYPPDGRRIPDAEEPGDPYEAMCLVLQNSMLQSLRVRVSILIGACKRLNVDGVLNRSHIGCRTVAGDALMIKNAITKELGIPVLPLEWEGFDPRVYDHEQYKKRFEVFKTML